MDNRHNWVQLLELHIDEIALLVASTHLPASTFEEESITVCTLSGEHCEVILIVGVLYLCTKADVIKR